MNKKRRLFRHPVAVLIILLLTWSQATARSQRRVMDCSLVQKLTDEQVVETLASSNEEEASQAVQEIIRRGPRVINLLIKNKGNQQPFRGGGLGNHRSSVFIPDPTGNKEFDEGRVITVEVASLYLISAIYYGTLEFAQSPYLTDMSLPLTERRAFNSRHLIERAWIATFGWTKALEAEGIEVLRSKKQNPLKDSGVNFW